MIHPSVSSQHALHLAFCEYLRGKDPKYDWIGFYWMDTEDEALHLGAYVGAATSHTRIPFGRGICGQVALSGKPFVVPDVRAQPNYLACSIETKSELVIPIFKEGILVGQLDIDSHSANAFSEEDQTLIKNVCEAVALLL